MIAIRHKRTGQILHRLDAEDLRGADLAGLELQEARFAGKDVTRANLAGARLRGASFRGAELREANMAGAHLERTYFKGAVYDARTRWPAGFDPQEYGCVRQEE